MNKHKFDSDWLKDPEVMKEIFHESMIERDEIIARYQKALEDGLKITENSKNTWLQMINAINKEALGKMK
jgi:hypothetical protein